MFTSNIQSIIMDKGKVDRVSNNRMDHATRREAFDRVLKATQAAGKPKGTIYYRERQYTVVI